MDWIIWLIVIVLIVAVVWWLLNRNNSRGTASRGSTVASTPAERPASAGSAVPTESPEPTESPASAGIVPERHAPEAAAPQAEQVPASAREGSHGAHAAVPVNETPDVRAVPVEAAGYAGETEAAPPVHHSEYTEPHAPTLPGAESAAAEAETLQAAASAAATEGSASHTNAPATQPAGHLASDQPYGEGSAAPAADGSGPAGFTVKGDASSMTYHEETSPGYGETRAEVWFESAAHAEAAGFRPPRRARL